MAYQPLCAPFVFLFGLLLVARVGAPPRVVEEGALFTEGGTCAGLLAEVHLVGQARWSCVLGYSAPLLGGPVEPGLAGTGLEAVFRLRLSGNCPFFFFFLCLLSLVYTPHPLLLGIFGYMAVRVGVVSQLH